ncbi:MAG: DUF455 family protein [Verrucomicrobia bacterium]|nr:DUF455 family protein [Verrucomicrobiota bacterium]
MDRKVSSADNWGVELREFAERILCATTLEEKLIDPPGERLTDERPGPAWDFAAEPGRPAELRFKSTGSDKAGTAGKAEFPGLHGLDNEAGRGKVLHFFANHELLATELMALALLRFPDAPPAFRRGVLHTLREEQEHVRLYLDRMKACGIRFGSLPVSGYFWRSVAPMREPMDFVTGLSLTFEQANLDFARVFSRGFAEAGDLETAALLQRILHDEIGHVAHGLKWFRQWKDPSSSDWDAFCGSLRFPLSPQRAKGVEFNLEARRAAGLDPEFIAQLELFARSKGRTPQVFLFNPLAEGYIARGLGFTPAAPARQLARDLAHLPQFLARRDDVVVVPEAPAPDFLATLKLAGFELPEFVVAPEGVRLGNGHGHGLANMLGERKLGGLRPWAWAPDSLERLGPLFPQVSGDDRGPDDCFNSRIAELYSKAWSARFFQEIHPELAAVFPALCPVETVGLPVTELPAALEAIRDFRARGFHRLVVKQALGLAGANAIRLWEPELLETQRRWMADALEAGQTLVVEPWMERLADFSVQFERTDGSLKRIGFTDLFNDHRGQFLANGASPGFERRPPARVVRAFNSWPDAPGLLRRVYEVIASALEMRLAAIGFCGPVGIDGLVCQTPEGPRLKPVVEINPRYTMGRLTLELMRVVAPGSHGLFRLVNRSQLKASGFATFADYAQDAVRRHPLHRAGSPQPRLREGAVCLNDPSSAQACLAVLEVSREAPESVVPVAPLSLASAR